MSQDTSKDANAQKTQNGDSVEVSEEALAAASEKPAEDAAQETAAETEEESPPSPEKELSETKDKLLRTLAEMENLRRRTQKEREDTAKYAVSAFARDVLTVADNLRRAIDSIPEESAQSDDTVKGIVDGLQMVERELAAAFERAGIKSVDPLGEKFTHEYHEAMFEVPTNDSPPGTVVQVMEIGYTLHDRLLRPARVGVAKALPAAPPQEGVDTTA